MAKRRLMQKGWLSRLKEFIKDMATPWNVCVKCGGEIVPVSMSKTACIKCGDKKDDEIIWEK